MIMQQNFLRDRSGAVEGRPVEAYGASRDLNVSVIRRPQRRNGLRRYGLGRCHTLVGTRDADVTPIKGIAWMETDRRAVRRDG